MVDIYLRNQFFLGDNTEESGDWLGGMVGYHLTYPKLITMTERWELVGKAGLYNDVSKRHV
jgi:hypothetical protein